MISPRDCSLAPRFDTFACTLKEFEVLSNGNCRLYSQKVRSLYVSRGASLFFFSVLPPSLTAFALQRELLRRMKVPLSLCLMTLQLADVVLISSALCRIRASHRPLIPARF
jgi:hypothetical protein